MSQVRRLWWVQPRADQVLRFPRLRLHIGPVSSYPTSSSNADVRLSNGIVTSMINLCPSDFRSITRSGLRPFEPQTWFSILDTTWYFLSAAFLILATTALCRARYRRVYLMQWSTMWARASVKYPHRQYLRSPALQASAPFKCTRFNHARWTNLQSANLVYSPLLIKWRKLDG